MTDLTARELLDTILRSWMATRATFKKVARPPAEDEATLQPGEKEVGQVKEPADQDRR
jgi:hypothetical protein